MIFSTNFQKNSSNFLKLRSFFFIDTDWPRV